MTMHQPIHIVLTKTVLYTNGIYVMDWPVMPAVMSPIEYV